MNETRRRIRLGALACALAVASIALAEESSTRRLEILSPVYTVDREYRSMQGPQSTEEIAFPEASRNELLWITGFRTEMVGEDGETAMPAQFMCHTNLDFDRQAHGKLLDLPVYHTDRLFTLSQGQLDLQLPEGFGLPFYSDEPLWLNTQVLDLNPDGESHSVRHRVTIEYRLDSEVETPMQPLFMTSGWGLVLLDGEDGFFGVEEPGEEHGEGCLAGEGVAEDTRTDAFGRKFSGHWRVEPGRQVNRTLVTKILRLPYDTTAHSILVHLHPFAESLELVDLTTGESVFKSRVEGVKAGIGIERVESYSSDEGIALHHDHEYELVSTYDNTTDRDQDSMAVMMLYLLDKKFKKRTAVNLSDL